MKQTQIPLTSFTDYVCEAPAANQVSGRVLNQPCGGREFVPAIRIKTYKGVLSGGQQLIAQIPLFRCVACGAFHDLNTKP